MVGRRQNKEIVANVVKDDSGSTSLKVGKESNSKNENIDAKLDIVINALNNINKRLDDYKATVDLISAKYDEVLLRLNTTEKKLADQAKIVSNQSKKIEDLGVIVNQFQQKDLNTKIVIRGMPMTSGKDLKPQVTEVLKTLDSSINGEQIKSAYVMGKNKDNSKSGPIVVELHSSLLRKNILQQKKELSKKTNWKNIFIHELITPEIYKLFLRVRNFKTQFKYQHAYTLDGRIFVRKNNDVKSIWIRSQQHLDDIIFNSTIKN